MKTASQNQLYMKMLNFFNAADTGGIHFNLPPTQRRAEFISISHQRRGGRNSFQSPTNAEAGGIHFNHAVGVTSRLGF